MRFLAVWRFWKELCKEIEIIEKNFKRIFFLAFNKFNKKKNTNIKNTKKNVGEKTCSRTFSFIKVKKFERYWKEAVLSWTRRI